MPELPLSVQTLPVAHALRPGETTTQHVLVRIRAAREVSGPKPRLTAVLVLDVSGSMQGQPLAQVVDSARRLSEILGDDDRLGIVAFDTAARTVSPVRALTREGRRAVQSELASVRAGGGTNISAGLAHAALLLPNRERDERQVLLLLSDGEPNAGSVSPDALGEETRRIKDRGAAVSTLGYGAHHKEAALIAVADAGGGRYAFVAEPQLAGPSFARALGAQRDVVAEDVRLVLTPSEGVEIVRVLENPPVAFAAGGLRVTLQDALAGDELNVVVELRVAAPREAGPWRMLKVALAYRPAGSADSRTERDEAAVTLTNVGPYDNDREAESVVAVARAAELREEARRHGDARNFAAAAAVLRRAKDLLAAVPGFVVGATTDLNDAYEALIDEIAVMEKAPTAEDYHAYTKAARDYADFAQGGVRMRTGGGLKMQTASAQAMAQAMSALPLPPAVLRMIAGPGSGAEYRITSNEVRIGRSSSCDIVVHSDRLSRVHAMVVFNGGQFFAVDMKSTNGILVNGRLVRDPVPLGDKDVLMAGDAAFVLERR